MQLLLHAVPNDLWGQNFATLAPIRTPVWTGVANKNNKIHIVGLADAHMHCDIRYALPRATGKFWIPRRVPLKVCPRALRAMYAVCSAHSYML